MKVGDLVKIVKVNKHRLSEEKQHIGTVIKMGTTVNQMTVLTQFGKIKFWFNHQCEVVS